MVCFYKNLNMFLLFWINILLVGFGLGQNVTDDVESCKCGMENFRMVSYPGGTRSPLLYPWAVAITDSTSGISFCGGTLITKNEVLTSAGCVEGKKPEDIKLILGVHDLSKVVSKDKYKVNRIIMHEHYKKNELTTPPTYEHDVALIEIKGDVPQVPNILPICLSMPPIDIRTELTVLGWGQLSPDDKSPAQRLQMLSLIRTPLDICGKIWKREFNKHSITCMGQEHQNICNGDYGGPLQFQDKSGIYELIGTASTSGPVCGDVYPGVYTTPYRNWIRNNSKHYSKCYNT